MSQSKWEEYYKDTPLDEIPWQKTQADYFIEIIDSGKIKPGTALDLGCGTGIKSIYLAKRGFKVTGIDISETAINYAKENAKKERVKVNFIVADATNLSFLKDKKFNFILDWANFHGILKNEREKYIAEIARHAGKDSKLLLRCFSKKGTTRKSVIRPMSTVYLFSKQDIKNLFSKYFKILETNTSKPFGEKAPGKWLDEYLMIKK